MNEKIALAENEKGKNPLLNEKVCSLEKTLGENEKVDVNSLRDLAELCEECVEDDNSNCTANISADEFQRYAFILHNKINCMRQHTNKIPNKLASTKRKSDQLEKEYLLKIEENVKRIRRSSIP